MNDCPRQNPAYRPTPQPAVGLRSGVWVWLGFGFGLGLGLGLAWAWVWVWLGLGFGFGLGLGLGLAWAWVWVWLGLGFGLGLGLGLAWAWVWVWLGLGLGFGLCPREASGSCAPRLSQLPSGRLGACSLLAALGASPHNFQRPPSDTTNCHELKSLRVPRPWHKAPLWNRL